MSLNINNDKNDSSYRYKMPTINIHQTGKGNGCFTKLINLRKISESLNYPPNILLKFIGIYLGCNVNSKNNIINGHHKNTEIQSIIFEFINNYSICPSCSIPELRPVIQNFSEKMKKKKAKILFKCSSCGNSSNMSSSKYYSKMFNQIVDYLLKNNNEWIKNKGMVMSSSVKTPVDLSHHVETFINDLNLSDNKLSDIKKKNSSYEDSSDDDDNLNPF